MRKAFYIACAVTLLALGLACGDPDPQEDQPSNLEWSSVPRAVAGAKCDTEGTQRTTATGETATCAYGQDGGSSAKRLEWTVIPVPSADGSLGAGVYEVGAAQGIAPGKWQTPGTAEGFGCYWQRSKDASGTLEAIIANGNIAKGAPGIVQVAATDKFVTFSGSCRWSKTG